MAAIWESHKDTLRTLYIIRGETLKSIMAHMTERYGFAMSKGQYERWFKRWRFCKNSNATSWSIIGRKVALRQRQGKMSVVRRDGEEISQEKLTKERRHVPLLELAHDVNMESTASTPEGFTVCTPQYDAMPRISVNNLPSLKLFSLLRLHTDPINVLFGHSNQDLVSRMARYDSKGNAESASALVHCADWVQSLTGDRYPYPDNTSDSTTFEIDIPLGLSSISRAGENSRLLLSIIHSAANNLLSTSRASEVLSVVLDNGNRKIFQALIAGQSPATKAIARTFLPAAIDSLDCPLVSTLLDTGINPNSYVDDSRRRPLQISIASQSMEITQLLLGRGADVDFPFVTYGPDLANTPLKAAVETCNLDLVQLLLQARAHVNDPDPRYGLSPLNLAARTGLLTIVQLLLDAGAEVNGPPCGLCRETALQAAASAGNIEVVQLLLSYGADVNPPRNEHGRTTLDCAASSGDVDVIELLLSHGSIDAISALRVAGLSRHNGVVNHFVHSWMTSHILLDDGFCRTALRAATCCGDFDLVQTLLKCGVNVDAPSTGADTTWRTALQIAVYHGDIRIAKLLLDYGADVNAPALECWAGATALQAAVSDGHIQLVQLLLDHGADVNAPAARAGRTALAAAACWGHTEILQLLLDFGADMKNGASVVAEAAGNVPLEFLRFLLDSWKLAGGGGLDCNFDGLTALEIAARSNDVGLIRLLLEYEAGDRSLALRGALYDDGVDTGVVELLLASGADVGYLDDDNGFTGDEAVTALGWAARIDRPDILGLLLEHRSDQTTAHDKSQALQTAVYDGKLDSARLLLDHGANVNAAPMLYLESMARTALQAAAENGGLEMVRLLLEAGANVESKVISKTEQGTALQFAAIAGSMSVVTVLIQKGADVNAPAIGARGRTALEGAAEHGRLDIVQLLLSLGVEADGSRAIQFARKEGHDGVVALLEEGSS